MTNASPRWGPHAGRNRALLQSLAFAASQARSRVIDWGVRSYALGAGLGRSTCAEVLRELAAEDDPFVTLVAGGVYEQADSYRLRLPDTVSLRRRGAGIKPRPVPDVLIDRPKSGLGVYQALSSRPRTVDELVAAQPVQPGHRVPAARRARRAWPGPADPGREMGARPLGGWSPRPGAPAAISCAGPGCGATAGNGGRGGLGSTPGTGPLP